MDSLLGAFTKKYINSLNQDELYELNDFLNLDDETLFKLNQGKNVRINIKQNSITNLFKNYIYEK